MKGFLIEITNNLLDPKHYKAMGKAVWVYMWCLDKITRIDDDGTGWLLGKKPIKLDEVNTDIGVDKANISRMITRLTEKGYLSVIRTPYGLVIGVNKAKKRFSKNAILSSKESCENDKSRCENDKSNKDNKSVDSNTNVLPVGETPAEKMRRFLKAHDEQNEDWEKIVCSLPVGAELELRKFVSYWTEPNKSGSKQRWELEKTFEVKRRLATWFDRAAKHQASKAKKQIVQL